MEGFSAYNFISSLLYMCNGKALQCPVHANQCVYVCLSILAILPILCYMLIQRDDSMKTRLFHVAKHHLVLV